MQMGIRTTRKTRLSQGSFRSMYEGEGKSRKNRMKKYVTNVLKRVQWTKQISLRTGGSALRVVPNMVEKPRKSRNPRNALLSPGLEKPMIKAVMMARTGSSR